MRRISILTFIIFFSSCNSGNEKNIPEELSQDNQYGWRPKALYLPSDPKAIQLNDSAAVLQIRAVQDPTLTPEESNNMIEEAYTMLIDALRIDPKYSLALTNLSAVYLEKRDTAKALELMMKRLELEPEMAEGWQAVGVFTDMLGDSAKAISYYEKSIGIFDERLRLGKKYQNPDDIFYYYDNWSGKAFSLLLSGKTKDAHNSIRALLDEAGVILGIEAETYAAMLNKDRWSILKEMKGE